MQLYQGSHLVPPLVKSIPRETPKKSVDQTDNDPVELIPTEMEDLSNRKLNLTDPGPSNFRNAGSDQDLYDDQRKVGHAPMGGYDAFMGWGVLAPGLSNWPMEKVGFTVPEPELSFEVRRRVKLRPHIAPEYYGACAPELNPASVVDNYIRTHVVAEGYTKSHQHGYKATRRGEHGPDLSVNNATFGAQDAKPSQFVDPNKEANTFKYGNQKAVPNDNYGVPTLNLDGPTTVSLKSKTRVPAVNKRAKGARVGGRRIAGNDRIGFGN